MIDLPPVNYQQTVEVVARCGIPPVNIRAGYDAEFQLDVVSIAPLDDAPSDDQLRCVEQATLPFGYDVRFADPTQNSEFWRVALEEGRRRARLQGEAWLRDRGLFDNMPRYDADRSSVRDFAREVEGFCGLEPGSALELFSEGLLAPRRSFLGELMREPGGSLTDKFTCLMNVLAASDLGEGGVSFGFVGRGAAADEIETD